jgi:hypothetical protein
MAGTVQEHIEATAPCREQQSDAKNDAWRGTHETRIARASLRHAVEAKDQRLGAREAPAANETIGGQQRSQAENTLCRPPAPTLYRIDQLFGLLEQAHTINRRLEQECEHLAALIAASPDNASIPKLIARAS